MSEPLTTETFKNLKSGSVIINIHSHMRYRLAKPASTHPLIWQVSNLKYFGKIDYVNENTCTDYITENTEDSK